MQKWTYKCLAEMVDVLDSLRKPVNKTERANRISGKPLSALYPYYGATGEAGHIDDFVLDGEYVLLGEDGAPFLNPFASKAYLVSGKCWVNNHAHILRAKGDNRFLCYYLNSLNYQEYVSGTTRLKLTQATMRKIPVPDVSLKEQKHIVSRIEEMFSELDKAVETLQTTKKQLAVYRQAVLKDAFADLQEKKTILELSSIVTSGSRGWAKYYSDRGEKFVRIGNLTRNKICLNMDDIQYVSLPASAEGKRTKLKSQDVLISITADLGSIALVPDDIGDAYVNQHIAMVRFNNSSQGKFMAWYLRSEYGQKDLLKNKRGGGKLGLGLDDIRNSRVPYVSDETARTVVALIESRLSVCDSIEQTVEKALAQAEAMRQSILKEAFEGRLI